MPIIRSTPHGVQSTPEIAQLFLKLETCTVGSRFRKRTGTYFEGMTSIMTKSFSSPRSSLQALQALQVHLVHLTFLAVCLSIMGRGTRTELSC